MASEDGAGIVSNVGYDVNNTSQRAAKSIGSETADGTSSATTWHAAVERTAGCASDPASNSPGTPTGFPAASPFHTNTEGHALRRDLGPAASSCGDVEERGASEPNNETQQPSQQRNMSHQRTDLDGAACLPGGPDGNLVSCRLLLRKAFRTVFPPKRMAILLKFAVFATYFTPRGTCLSYFTKFVTYQCYMSLL